MKMLRKDIQLKIELVVEEANIGFRSNTTGLVSNLNYNHFVKFSSSC